MPDPRRFDSLLLAGASVANPGAAPRRADVLIEAGRITRIGAGLKSSAERLDCRGRIIAPGLIDLHCHLREPGREDEETVATGARAALCGGFTRICPMPNTDPPADTEAAIRLQLELGRAAGFARILPVGCCTRRREGKELADIGAMSAAGAVGFSDDGSPVADAMVMRRCLEYCKAFDKPVMSHCEVRELVEGLANEDRPATRLGLKTSPDVAESAQAARDILLAELTGARLHLCHVSCAATVELIRWAKSRGVQVTAETCPHYFTLTDEALGSFDPNLKVNPPLRTETDRRAIIAALADGTIDAIATDHAPHLAGEKEAEWDAAPPGIIGFETAWSLGYEQLVRSGALGLGDYLARLTTAPARILGLPEPQIAEGAEADLIIIDPKAEWDYTADRVRSRARNTPFLGRRLSSRVCAALLADRLFTF